jgi:2-dehydro-3-deoxygalactonokinase
VSAPASASTRRFLSCDWGTSAFRLRLVEGASRRVLAASRGEQSIAATFAAWKTAGGQPEDRWSYFSRIVAQHIARIAGETGGTLAGLPLVISGMASSSMGMCELPYARLPLAIDGSGLAVEHVAAREDFSHAVVIISGVRSTDDVMRGEETQLIGACALGAAQPAAPERPRVFVFPGTHSKHVDVRGAHAVAFLTYMTGEFFELLSAKSVLANSVTPGTDLGTPENLAGFAAGVRAGAAGNVLNAAFHVRTRALLEQAAATANYHYLSGVLIGAELRELAAADAPITLVGAGTLLAAYEHAFQVLGARAPLASLDADDCLIAGQLTVATRLGLL